MTNHAKALIVLSILAATFTACTVIGQPQEESPQLPDPVTVTIAKNTTTPTVQAVATTTPTTTPIPDTPTPTRTATPTARWQVQVTQIEPSLRNNQPSEARSIKTASWIDDDTFAFGFVTGGFDSAEQITHWAGYTISAHSEITITSPINYDDSFWARNHVEKIAWYPELEGHFSPSGKYVIYSVWHGSVFDKKSKTEIWVAETRSLRKVKVFEFGYSNVYINHATWYDNENKVLFSAGYEGPAEFYVADIPSHKTVPLSDVTQFGGATEYYGRLSPDGTLFAVVDMGHQLLLVPMDNRPVTTLEESITSYPVWSKDGKRLYYWWGPDRNHWQDLTELRAYDVSTGSISTVIDKPSLESGFHDYQHDNPSLQREVYLGAAYSISSDEEKLLMWWGNYLYLVSIIR